MANKLTAANAEVLAPFHGRNEPPRELPATPKRSVFPLMHKTGGSPLEDPATDKRFNIVTMFEGDKIRALVLYGTNNRVIMMSNWYHSVDEALKNLLILSSVLVRSHCHTGNIKNPTGGPEGMDNWPETPLVLG